MTTALDAAWAQATADVDQSQPSGERPEVGLYVAQVVDERAGTAKSSGEFYFSVTFALPDGRRWDEIKMITKNGVLHEGRAKSAAIMLRGLGIVGDAGSPTNLPNTIGSIHGKFYSVEITQSSQVNSTTGAFYRNTEINGPANGWAQAPAPVASDVPAPVMTQPPAQPVAGMPQPAPMPVPAPASAQPTLDGTFPPQQPAAPAPQQGAQG